LVLRSYYTGYTERKRQKVLLKIWIKKESSVTEQLKNEIKNWNNTEAAVLRYLDLLIFMGIGFARPIIGHFVNFLLKNLSLE
jgi:hypothetical protein